MLINNKYEIIQLIGKGGFSKVYLAKNNITNEYVAIKMEKLQTTTPVLKIEAEIYILLQKRKINISPKFKCYGIYKKYSYIVLEFIDTTLTSIMKEKTNLSFDYVCQLGQQMIYLLKSLHSQGILHRDIKPGNFVFSKNAKSLKLIDFGLSKVYLINNVHIPIKEGYKMLGTAKYASLNIHHGIEYSRRDDIESMIYTLIELYKGVLPWGYCICKDKQDTYKIIEMIKDKCNMERFCGNEAIVLVEILDYIRSLNFDDEPNYEWIKNKLNI
tara:strand:- start:1021 stop:1833 length:813 start_codon:yes stop_codon:yes gene_type:complete